MKKIGVLLARLQPIHNGHLALIESALRANDEVYIFIGSANKFNARNPIPISLREQLAQEAIFERFPDEISRIKIIRLDDLTDETNNSYEWGTYLYANVVHQINQSTFSLYYSDGFEIVASWFYGFLLRDFISLALFARNSIEKGISATTVRQTILDCKDEELEKIVPRCVYNCKDSLRRYIQLSHMER